MHKTVLGCMYNLFIYILAIIYHTVENLLYANHDQRVEVFIIYDYYIATIYITIIVYYFQELHIFCQTIYYIICDLRTLNIQDVLYTLHIPFILMIDVNLSSKYKTLNQC